MNFEGFVLQIQNLLRELNSNLDIQVQTVSKNNGVDLFVVAQIAGHSMNCPMCGKEMISGVVQSDREVFG